MSEAWQFQQEQVQAFRHWLNLVPSDLRWTKAQSDLFEKFWSLFFIPGQELGDIHTRFFEIEEQLETGTLRQWLRWLRNRFNCFLFVHEKMNLRDLALDSHYRINDLAFIVRDFFIREYPDHRSYFDERINIGNYLSENLHVSISHIEDEIGLSLHEKCHNRNDLMASLEVPLFEEFSTMIELLQKKSPRLSVSKTRKQLIKINIDTLKYLVLFFILSFGVIWGIKKYRQWNHWKLTEEVKVLAPRFYNEFEYENSIQRSLSEPVIIEDRTSGMLDELKAQPGIDSSQQESFFRDSTESDILLSSLDNVPLPLKSTDLQKSSYEESKKGGYRDYKYGRYKAYRLMINAQNSQKIVEEINQKLKMINYKKVDSVEPGKAIPGGNYYNLYVANKDLKSLLEVYEKRGASLFVSQSPVVNPKGMSRLFIWVKSL